MVCLLPSTHESQGPSQPQFEQLLKLVFSQFGPNIQKISVDNNLNIGVSNQLVNVEHASDTLNQTCHIDEGQNPCVLGSTVRSNTPALPHNLSKSCICVAFRYPISASLYVSITGLLRQNALGRCGGQLALPSAASTTAYSSSSIVELFLSESS